MFRSYGHLPTRRSIRSGSHFMSKRGPSAAPKSRKKSKLVPRQAVLDSYFRSPSSNGPPVSSSTIRAPSNVVYEEPLATLDSDTISLHEVSHAGLGTQEDPIQLDSGDERDSSRDQRVYTDPGQSAPARTDRLAVRLPEERLEYSPVAIDPLEYPIQKHPWPVASPAPYSFLVHTLVVLAETRSRIKILDALVNSLRCLILYHPPSLLPALYLLSNSLSPAYSPLELGIGASVISRAIQHVSSLTPATLKKLYNTLGDPGDVAYEAKSNVRTLVAHSPLLIETVYETLLKIANVNGQGAAKQKQSIVERLLVAARGEESRFLVRTLCQNLRVGAVRTTILTALARALVLSPPLDTIPNDSLHATPQLLASVRSSSSGKQKKNIDPGRNQLLVKFANAEALVKHVYVQHPNYDNIIAGVLAGGLDGLAERVPLTVGIPLHPTLGFPARSLDEIYDWMNEMPFTAEFKYDGQRAQIHAFKAINGLSVHIFSRHLENMTEKYPDVVAWVRCMFGKADLSSFIIDSEIVAIDPQDGTLESFQTLSNRAKKNVAIQHVQVPVCVFAFDILYLDGQTLLERPLRERRDLLRTKFPVLKPREPGTAHFDHVGSCESDQGRERIEAFWQRAVDSRCEGLMLLDNDPGVTQTRKRPLLATYEPDKRTYAWLKLKKDYVEGFGDSLDLVPVGAWHGNGRKAGWWSPILLAVWDADKERLIAVCKCMSGFSDVFYKDLTSRYPKDADDCSYHPLGDYDVGGFKPDVYFRPHEVWEIRGADITLSPVSLAALGQVSCTRGLSLRFPRFVCVREDKGPEDATTAQQLAQMYRDQQSRGKDTGGADEGDLLEMEVEVEESDESRSS